ncbi:serine/threonine-protein kinase MRCK alpha-like isoform X2 [Limulus polyphemus]|uniref:non-specific serine/threonine protein kinase n=1 Tax=Limulus polyphemus TaxID=6850 RepID=A0ABM1SCY8_LIMPO|nr:serine/threonine-protein kinase MRCK alpha-like isoform X2 [Limulus polyphemus]
MGPEERLRELEQLFLGGPVVASGNSFSVETLLDVLLVLYEECCNSSLRREKTVSQFIDYAKPVVQKIRNLCLTKDDFEIIKVIGRGAFGEVAVVRQLRDSDKVYAMKILNKWEMLKRAETACFHEERDVLVHGDKRWITNLHYAFQDDSNLYLVMDYYCGGDLLTLLSKFEDRLPEEMARFYIAEMILAIDAIHKLNYVHRDIKPDNVLLDANGHIRLADFGSCLKLCEDGTVQSNVAVGTPDYISPEILRAMEDGQGRYGPECDWWSLGVCMYEMLFGETPFYAESLVETYGKIMNHKNCFDFPDDPLLTVSKEAKDLMTKLICSAECRLGQKGIEDFKNHPWFEGVDWDHIRDGLAPYIPEVSSPTDTSNFDDVDENDLKGNDSVPPSANSVFSGLHLPFIGFTYTFGSFSKPSNWTVSSYSEDQVDHLSDKSVNWKIKELEREKLDMSKKVKELTLELHRIQQEHTDAVITKQQLDPFGGERSTHVANLEKTISQIRLERDELRKDLEESEEKLKQQAKELKDALGQKKLAMSEYSEVSDKLSELRAQKQKLSRQVRDKEEEVENAMQKIDSLRQELRKAEKLRREFEFHFEESQTEVSKEKRMRERSEDYVRHLEEELESLKQRQVGRATNNTNSEATQEINRLKTELENLNGQHKTALGQQQAKYTTEVTNLKEQVQEADNKVEILQKEISGLKEKLEQARSESALENQEMVNEMKRIHEREKNMLHEENKKLVQEIERLSEGIRKQQDEKKRVEEELNQLLEKKDSIAQWEAQISEIIQWVSDEKDARGYLQALATKMTEELEWLKMSGVPSAEKNWRNRRSQKLDKMELLNLQSSLNSEIHAKQAIGEELSHVRADLVAQQKELRECQQKLELSRKELLKKDSHIKELQLKLERIESGERYQFLKDTSVRLARSDSGEAGDEADVEDNQPPSVSSGKSNVSDDHLPSPVSPLVESKPIINLQTPKLQAKAHQFLVRTFVAPLKCNLCTSLMVGLIRQGAVCEVCGFACHVGCQDKVPAVCPVPADQTSRPVGIDPTKGIGTAYEGYVKVPKPAGVKKGWMRQFVVVCDFKLFFYDLLQDKNAQPSVCVSQVLDMRGEEFSVSSVLESDVIHANKKDIPCIFRVTTAMMDPPGLRNHTLMLVDRESEKNKWVDALNELLRILRRNKHPNRTIYQAKEILDSTLVITKNVLSAAIIDQDRISLGTEEGLYCVDLDSEEIARIGDGKKISLIEYIAEEQLLIVVSGKQRHIRLIPIRALDGHDVDWIKVSDTKGCVSLCVAPLQKESGHVYHFCVAVKRQVVVYQINRTKGRHHKFREIALPAPAQCMEVMNDKVCVGFPSVFYLYSLQEDTPPICLVQPESSALSFLIHNPMDAWIAIEISNREFLLVFSHFGVYVDHEGKKSRERELMFPAIPVAVSYRDSFLTVYSDTHIDVFEVSSSEWVQTINIRKTKPLSRTGELSITWATDLPHLIYLHNVQHRDNLVRVPEVMVQNVRGRSGKAVIARTRRRFSVREAGKGGRITDRKSRMISGPTNFNHITHMGPGEFYNLKDLPTAQEEKMHRVRSLLQQGKVSIQKGQPGSNASSERPFSSLSHSHNGGPIGRRPAPPTPQRPFSSLTAGSPDSSHSSQEHSATNVSSLTTGSGHGISGQEGHGEESSPRHSIVSNNSSNLSFPPSPDDSRTHYDDGEHGSSSYDS